MTTHEMDHHCTEVDMHRSGLRPCTKMDMHQYGPTPHKLAVKFSLQIG